jgi:hypothetical protein
MSWQAYVDDHLMCEIDGQHLAAAAILGLDGSPWAQSPGFPEVKAPVFPLYSHRSTLFRPAPAALDPGARGRIGLRVKIRIS